MAAWNETLATLFASHRQKLESFVARRTRDPETAADLAQETFLRLARMVDGDKVEDPSKFLFTVAANLVRDHHRHLNRQPAAAPLPLDDHHPADSPGIERVVAARQDLTALRAAIRALPPKTRAVFLLYRVDGMSYRDIAARLDISPRTVEYHLRQALAQCRQALRQAQGEGP